MQILPRPRQIADRQPGQLLASQERGAGEHGGRHQPDGAAGVRQQWCQQIGEETRPLRQDRPGRGERQQIVAGKADPLAPGGQRTDRQRRRGVAEPAFLRSEAVGMRGVEGRVTRGIGAREVRRFVPIEMVDRHPVAPPEGRRDGALARVGWPADPEDMGQSCPQFGVRHAAPPIPRAAARRLTRSITIAQRDAGNHRSNRRGARRDRSAMLRLYGETPRPDGRCPRHPCAPITAP